MRKVPKKSASAKSRALLLLLLVVLTVAVRLYYNSGPVYGLGDEGIYLNIISQAIVFKNYMPLSFSAYSNINFNNHLNPNFNPANVFKFYIGFLYPEILFSSLVGYSAANVIYYIIFNSAIECIFLFLIIELVYNRRAAAVGALLFAFFPLDVMLSVRVLPVIPMAAMLTVSVYLFLRGLLSKSHKQGRSFFLLCGIFIGLAYLIHPEGVILLPFLLLYLLIYALRNRQTASDTGINMLLILVGAFIAFSIAGTFYLLAAKNFFLYPLVDHNVFLYQFTTQPLYNVSIGNVLSLSYTTGTPLSYLDIMLRFGLTQNLFYTEYNLFYFSIIGYLAIAGWILLLFRSNKGQHKIFGYMLLFYIVALSFVPTSISVAPTGKIILTMVNSDVIYASVLALPAIAIVAIVIEKVLSNKRKAVKCLAIGVILLCIAISITQLNYDSSIYRNSMHDVNLFVSYVKAHTNETFYAQPAFVQEAQDISGYKYINEMNALFNCGKSSIAQINNSYFAVGGTLSISWSPGVLSGYDTCVEENLTSAQVIYTAPNPYDNSVPLQILKEG